MLGDYLDFLRSYFSAAQPEEQVTPPPTAESLANKDIDDVDSLFRRLRKKTGIYVTAHLLRHSHATNLVRAGWDMSYVQKRLGHSDIQTTINTYVHLLDDDLKAEYQKYLEQRNLNLPSSETRDSHIDSYLSCFGTSDILSPKV
ncbi:MAG: tyrosine-type recombinase/integrase [Xenococcaceae cyanobacterium MO_207.B15]|nr:tyrosine-type recombinase/integrase [Xenococcaceae cyanobacterium MO_207.B15]